MRREVVAILASVGLASPTLALDRAPPATETVRACPGHGPGFFQLPGTTTCIRIGGRVVAEAGTSSRRVARDSIAGVGASGSVSLDARTDTEYGPLRSYVRVRAGQGTTGR